MRDDEKEQALREAGWVDAVSISRWYPPSGGRAVVLAEAYARMQRELAQAPQGRTLSGARDE